MFVGRGWHLTVTRCTRAGYPQSHPILPQHEQHLDGLPGNYGMGSAIPGHGHALGNYSALTNSNGLSLDRWRLACCHPCLIWLCGYASRLALHSVRPTLPGW